MNDFLGTRFQQNFDLFFTSKQLNRKSNVLLIFDFIIIYSLKSVLKIL